MTEQSTESAHTVTPALREDWRTHAVRNQGPLPDGPETRSKYVLVPMLSARILALLDALSAVERERDQYRHESAEHLALIDGKTAIALVTPPGASS